jgi:hypothetical protein
MQHGPIFCCGAKQRAPFPARAWRGASSFLVVEKRTEMSAFTEHKDELEHYEQMYGRERGRLAVGLDRLTNALVLVGQHGVYCTSQRNPTVPAMDVRMITQELVHAKELVQSVMEAMRKAREQESDSSLRSE